MAAAYGWGKDSCWKLWSSDSPAAATEWWKRGYNYEKRNRRSERKIKDKDYVMCSCGHWKWSSRWSACCESCGNKWPGAGAGGNQAGEEGKEDQPGAAAAQGGGPLDPTARAQLQTYMAGLAIFLVCLLTRSLLLTFPKISLIKQQKIAIQKVSIGSSF